MLRCSNLSAHVLGLVVAAVATLAGEGRLAEAAKLGDLETVRSVLTRANVNERQADGTTATIWAAHRDDVEMAKLLIQAGADSNAANELGVTPLSLACKNGKAEMVALLLGAGADPNLALPSGETPIMMASRSGNVEVVKQLLSKGANPNAKDPKRGHTALMWAVGSNHPDIAEILLKSGADAKARSVGGFSPMLFAAQQGNIDSARILLDAQASVNDASPEDGSALCVAVASGHEALAHFLLERGADPNLANRYGVTPLHFALMKGLARVAGVGNQPMLAHYYRPNMPGLVKALLQRGANPNARVTKFPPFPATRKISATSLVGATPFLLAAASYDVELMKFLVAQGADPSLSTKEKTTPLMMAAGLAEGLAYSQERQEDDTDALAAVQTAVAMGADVNATSAIGETALHGAAYIGANRVIEFLVSKGANVNAENKYGQTPLSIAEYIIPARLTDRFLRPFSVHRSTADLLMKLGATPFKETAEQPSSSDR